MSGPQPYPGQTIEGDVGGPELQGISVSDSVGVQRVLLGLIGTADSPDYGLKVVSSDGATVIIDGTANVFKIDATGTMSRTSSGTGLTSGTTSLTALVASTTPAHLSFVSTGNGIGDYQAIGSDVTFPGLATTDYFAAASSGGAVTSDFFGVILYAGVSTAVSAGSPLVTFAVGSKIGAFTFYCRYYVLREAAL